MSLVVVSDGRISSSILTPKHDATVHENSAVDGETYSTYFPSGTEVHNSTLVGLGTKTEAANVVTVGSGAGIGSSRFVKATSFTPSATMAVFRFKVASITNGAGDFRATLIGLSSDFTQPDPESANNLIFYQDNSNVWGCACKKVGGTYILQIISAIVAGDILTIAVSTAGAFFYVNSNLVLSVAGADIPIGALSVGFSCIGTAGTVTNTRELGIVYYAPTTPSIAAADVTNTPAGGIAATNVQAAINELDTEKLPLAGGTMTGPLAMGANAITTSSTVDGVDVSAIPTTYLPLAGGALTGAVTTNSTFDGVDVSQLKTSAQGVNALTPAASIAIDPTLGSVATLTPDQATSLTINPATLPGHTLSIILTATSVDRTVTFSTGFKGSASQATGTTAGKKFITMWVNDGTDYVYRGSGGPF